MVDTLGITVVHVSARRQYAGHCRREQPCGRKTPDLTPAGTRPAYMSHQLFCWFPSPSYLQSDATYLSCDGALGRATWTAALVTALGRRRSLPRSCAFTLLRARRNTGRAAIDPIPMSVASATDSRQIAGKKSSLTRGRHVYYIERRVAVLRWPLTYEVAYYKLQLSTSHRCQVALAGTPMIGPDARWT